MAVSGIEAAVFKHPKGVALATSEGARSVKIEVVNMNVTFAVSGSNVWTQQEGVSEHFGALRTKLKHFAHGRVAVDVGV